MYKQTIHGCFLVTGDCDDTIKKRLEELERILQDTIKNLPGSPVSGQVRPGTQAGHEHFGFLDDLSEPPVKGSRKPNKGEVATDASVILLRQRAPTDKLPGWATDGSFLAFRHLRQLVPEFHNFLAQNPIPGPEGSKLLGV